MDFYRRVVCGRVSEMAGEEGLPIDRLMRTLGIRRAAEREAATLDPELLRPAGALLRGGQRGRRRAPRRCRSRCSCCGSTWKPWRPVDILSLGKLLAFGLSTNWEQRAAARRHGAGPRPRAGRAGSTPTYPADNPVVTQEAWSGDGLAIVEQIDAVRRSIGLAAEASGSNNWAVCGHAQRHRLAADRRRPAPAPEHAGHLVPGRPHARRPFRPRRLAAGNARRLHGPEQRRLLDLHQRHGRRPGPLRRAGRGRPLPLRGRVAPAGGRPRGDPGQGPRRARGARRADHPPRADRQRGARRRRRPSRSPCAGRPSTSRPPSRACSSCTRSPPARSWSPSSRATRSPASNLIWADRHGSIGYKLIGRLPLRKGGCPDLPKPGWTGEFEWEGTIPYEELPETVDPESGFLVTANNRIVGDDYPHHITSEWLRRVPRASGSSSCCAPSERARHRELRGDAVRQPLAAGARGGAAAGTADARTASASAARSSGCAAGTAGSTPTRSRHRSTRPSCCVWHARSPAPRSATATSASAGSTAPTTASPHTSPRPGAGTRT